MKSSGCFLTMKKNKLKKFWDKCSKLDQNSRLLNWTKGEKSTWSAFPPLFSLEFGHFSICNSLSLSLSLSLISETQTQMALQLWETLKEAIPTYTGLSPATFFTVVALILAIYYVVSGLFGSSDNYERPRSFEEVQPPPPPVQIGEVTEEELKHYDGSDPQKPLLMAIKGQIYDVSQSRYSIKISVF